jgi:hypothetical protein
VKDHGYLLWREAYVFAERLLLWFSEALAALLALVALDPTTKEPAFASLIGDKLR